MHHFQFGNLKAVLIEPGNIKRMMMGRPLNVPIGSAIDEKGRAIDFTRNVIFIYCPDIPRFMDEYRKRNIGTITELAKLCEEAKSWPEKMR